jgi:hypoxanthine phosphoribosyltransferase
MTYQLVPLISEEMIASCVKRLAQEIDRDYGDRSPILVGILKGAFVFLADLIRQMETPIGSVEFIRISSYGSSTMSSGQVEIAMGLVEESIQSQDIILVEDIVDTGLSTATILEYIRVIR